jgi:phage terminase Nu1 subunit (DNA packaging protein)
MSADVIDTATVAAIYGVHVRTVHRWVESGRLPVVLKIRGKRGALVFDAAAVAGARAHSP